MSPRLKDTSTAACHKPRMPCLREVRPEMGQATTPVGVETADGPQQLPRHAEVGEAQTGRHNHHGVCYRPKAAVPWCLQGTAHCDDREQTAMRL